LDLKQEIQIQIQIAMTNPFKQKQGKQVIVKLTSKHHTTSPGRIKIGV
jgi:hypothetical protein